MSTKFFTNNDSKTLKSNLFTRILPELKQAAPYFSIDAVKNRLKQLKIEMSDSTLKHYMSDAMEQGVVYDAGRGWYSRLEEEFTLDTKPVSTVIQRIEKKFPILDFTCWSTRQINSFMHHIMTRFVTFVYTDRDSMVSVYDEIKSWKGYTVYLDPSSKEVEKTFQLDDKTIVIRPETTEAPGAGEGHSAVIEKLLVDLAIEVEKMPLMDRSEFQDVAEKIANKGRIRFGMLARYARRSHKDWKDIFRENNALMAQTE